MYFDAYSPTWIDRITIDLVEDGENPWVLDFPGTDGRSVRGFAIKPVIEGTFTLRITARDRDNCSATVDSPVKVTVVK